MDFAKAFDKVYIGMLSHNIKIIGFSGSLGVFLYNFLSQREEAILANGVESKVSKVKSVIKPVENETDIEDLQIDLEKLYEWQ